MRYLELPLFILAIIACCYAIVQFYDWLWFC
jgi:hypothetical protein